MGLNDTSSAQRVHIGFFGRRNSGKSSLVNAVTGQALSVVSDVLGTTTDPVQKSMELLPIGPVLIIDTPGMDDEGELGQLRVEKTRQILRKTDVAVVVMSAVKEPSEQEKELLALLQERKVPTILAVNKIDLAFEQDFEKWKHFAPGKEKYRRTEKYDRKAGTDCRCGKTDRQRSGAGGRYRHTGNAN